MNDEIITSLDEEIEDEGVELDTDTFPGDDDDSALGELGDLMEEEE